LESPINWIYWISNFFAMKREAQAPNNSTLLFVPPVFSQISANNGATCPTISASLHRSTVKEIHWLTI
jgi:hypothetical protein